MDSEAEPEPPPQNGHETDFLRFHRMCLLQLLVALDRLFLHRIVVAAALGIVQNVD